MNKEKFLKEIYNSSFDDELEKFSKFNPLIKSIKSFLKTPTGFASTGVGVSAVGAGFIDTREMPNRKAKTILPYWDEVKKHAKPGDVIVGANRPPAIISYFSDFKKQYDKYRKKLPHDKAIKKARELVNPITMVSKLGDPVFSHAAVIGPNGKTIYGGGGKARDITLRDIPKNKKGFEDFKKRGLNPYYMLLRPNKKDANKLNDLVKSKGIKTALKKVEKIAGNPKDYHLSRAIWEQVKRWTLPKIDKKEFVKSNDVRKLEKKMTGGICSTTAALLSDRTIAGKEAKKVLPKDITESPDFDIIAHIGPKREVPIGTRILFSSPKYGVKAGIGLLAGGSTYGIIKGVEAMIKSNTARKSLSKLILKK